MKFKLVFILIFYFSLLNNIYAQTNKILFKVNNEIITSLDLFEEAQILKIINSELNNLKNEKIYEIAKNSLIKQKVKKIELSKRLENFTIEDEVLDNLLLDYFRKFNFSKPNDVKKFLTNNKIDIAQIKERITIEILWNEYIYAKYSKKVKINKNEIEKELESMKFQDEYLLSELIFNLNENEKIDDKTEIIIDTIKNQGFSTAASIFSISNSAELGGKIDWIKSASLNKNIRDKINNLPIGSYTNPIVIPGGFLILKIENKRKTEIKLNLEKEINSISKKKTIEQLNQFSNIYYNKIKKDVILNEL